MNMEILTYRFCDILVSLYRKSYSYFFISLFLSCDKSSLENLLLCLVDWDPSFINFLPFISIYYYPISNFWYNIKVSFDVQDDALHFIKYKTVFSWIYYLLNIKVECIPYTDNYLVSHLPSFGICWFNYLHVFPEYSFLMYNILNVGFVYAISQFKYFEKIKFVLFYKQSTFRNYLLYNCKSRLLFIYCILYVLWSHVYYLVHTVGIGNVNFIFWTVFVFVIVFLIDTNSSKLKL